LSILKKFNGWVGWHMPEISAFEKLRQEDPELKARMGIIERSRPALAT
jgi:hypothetical protein